MKEYAIYCRIKKGKPFIVFNSTEKSVIISKLYELISYKEEYNETYYVENDFFHNIYIQINANWFYCIKEREVSDWQTYSKEKDLEKENNKIIYFHNFSK